MPGFDGAGTLGTGCSRAGRIAMEYSALHSVIKLPASHARATGIMCFFPDNLFEDLCSIPVIAISTIVTVMFYYYCYSYCYHIIITISTNVTVILVFLLQRGICPQFPSRR